MENFESRGMIPEFDLHNVGVSHNLFNLAQGWGYYYLHIRRSNAIYEGPLFRNFKAHHLTL
jgi:hypothetical protein